MEKIVIKQAYFDKIKSATDSINKFFESGFATKDFPTDTANIDWAVANVVDMIQDLDPVYVSNSAKLEEVSDDIADKIEAKGNVTADEILQDRVIGNEISSVISFASLQKIADNFDAFSKFINGIYTFELFLKPSQYRNEINIFSQNLELPYSLDDLDLNVGLFSIDTYVTNLMDNSDVKFPESFNIENEIARIQQFRDLTDAEVLVDNSSEQPTDQNVTEYAMPSHIKYDKVNDRFVPSRQLLNWTDKFISDMRSCNTIDELRTVVESVNPKRDSMLQDMIFPHILMEAFDASQSYYMENVHYTHDNTPHAKYSIYDTFKTDKDATLDYIEDYMKLNLVNNPNATIKNNLLLSMFNEYDSNNYLGSMYNMEATRKSTLRSRSHNDDMKSFMYNINSRINKNSTSYNMYKPGIVGECAVTSELQKSVDDRLESFKDISISDILTCESFKDILYDEIKLVPDKMYNKRVSPIMISKYLGDFYVEAETGNVPDYMKSRMELSDDKGETKVTEVPDPKVEPPQNSINDLADSVDEKMNMDGNMEDIMGKGFENNPDKKSGVVYNITYNNSFNKNDLSSHTDLSSHRTSGDSYDLSEGKDASRTNTVTHNNSHNTSSHQSSDSHNVSDSHDTKDSYNSYGSLKNNNNNSDGSLDSKGSGTHPSQLRKLSNGMTVEEMVTYLESEEPLSSEFDTTPERKPPKEDSLVRAMDRDRESRGKLQEAKRKTQKAVNTVRATFKPVSRTKKWLTKLVNSLVERDENKVKEEIIENPSYRTSLYKACRLAIKLGLTGIAFTISGWLGVAYVGYEGMKLADKQRLRREVQTEMISELKVMDEKIAYAKETRDQKELYKLMRLRSKMEGIAADASRGRWNQITSVNEKRSRYW